MKITAKEMTKIACAAALICVCAPWMIPLPVTVVPITLGTLAVYLVAAVLGAKKGTVAVALYLLIGIIGIPVFSGFRGGLGMLLGPTGGYLIGYLPLAFLSGLLIDSGKARIWRYPAAFLLGTLACYLCGTAYFVFLGGVSVYTAILSCVLPFIPADIIKIIIATVVAYPLRKRIDQL